MLCSCSSCRIVRRHCCVYRESLNVVLTTDEKSHLLTEVIRDWLIHLALLLLLLMLAWQQRYDM